MNRFNPLRFFFFHLLLLQLEEYDLIRLIIAVKNTKGLPPDRPFRKPLKFTPKIIILSLLTVLLMAITISKLTISPLFFTFYVMILLYFSYIYLIISLVLFFPIDFLVKQSLIILAKQKIRRFKSLKIIGIAGSYGKTGMKDIIGTILSEKFRVTKTPETVNTPVGIALFILKALSFETEILVVEMGEYYSGDIKNLCQLTRPDIAVITGINEAHLERLKTLDTTIKTIFEIASGMKPSGLLLLNNQDELIKKNYKKFLTQQTIYFYQAKDRDIEFNQGGPGYIYQDIFLPILGRFNLDKIDGAVFITKKLGLTEKEIRSGIRKITTPAHRLQPILNREKNILVIDDSYNGNPDGVEEAIKTLSLFKNRRKIFVTPGLVEIGEKTSQIHEKIGHTLNDVVDLVILIKNSVTPLIEKGLINAGFNQKHILFFDSAFAAQKAIADIIKPNDVILFQNDWPDNYV